MRVAAYVLLGDPAWLVPSIASYYDRVTKIVASFDENFASWGGLDMAPEMKECIRALELHDPQGKVILLPGAFACPDEHPQNGETRQRRASVLAASEWGDWVLQLDTDEVVPHPARLFHELEVTQRRGLQALEFPARWIYAHVRGRVFLEMSTRRLGTWEAIPGPVAVRRGSHLSFARHTDVPSRRLRIGRDSTPDRVPRGQAILHFSMVRSSASMRWKASVSGHATDYDWVPRLRLWDDARQRPARAIARSVVDPTFGTYRPVMLAKPFDHAMVDRETRAGDPERLRSTPLRETGS